MNGGHDDHMNGGHDDHMNGGHDDHMNGGHDDHQSCTSASQIGDESLHSMHHELHFTIVEFMPNELKEGLNSVKVEVKDEQGEAVSFTSFSVRPYMAQHGHGTSPENFEAESEMPGVYHFKDVNFLMSGLWDLNFTFSMMNSTPMEAMLKVCVGN
jgi:hypothetical protein